MAEYGDTRPKANKQLASNAQKYKKKSRPDGLTEFWGTSHWAAWFGIVSGVIFNIQGFTMDTQSSIHQIYQVLHLVGGDVLIVLGAMVNIIHKIRLKDSVPYEHEKY